MFELTLFIYPPYEAPDIQSSRHPTYVECVEYGEKRKHAETSAKIVYTCEPVDDKNTVIKLLFGN